VGVVHLAGARDEHWLCRHDRIHQPHPFSPPCPGGPCTCSYPGDCAVLVLGRPLTRKYPVPGRRRRRRFCVLPPAGPAGDADPVDGARRLRDPRHPCIDLERGRARCRRWSRSWRAPRLGPGPTAWRITAAYAPSSHVMANDPRTLPDWAVDDPLMRTAHLCRRETPTRRARFNTWGDGHSRHSRTRGPRRDAPETRAAAGLRRATSGSGSSTFQSSSVLTGTAELAAPVTNLRIIDQLTQPADPSQTASKQEAATGSAGGPETSGASPTFNPDPS
jgi:hypothetical protein